MKIKKRGAFAALFAWVPNSLFTAKAAFSLFALRVRARASTRCDAYFLCAQTFFPREFALHLPLGAMAGFNAAKRTPAGPYKGQTCHRIN